MSVKEVLRQSPAAPALRWARGRLRHYRLPREERLNHVYDAQTIQVLERTPGNYLDVGASAGAILKHMVSISPNGRHVAFEAIPESAERLRAEFPQVEVHAVALSEASGQTTFHVVREYRGRSGMRRIDYPTKAEVEEIRVPMDTIDNLVHHHVDVIKVDVEGAELQVLRGANRVLREHGPIVVFEHGDAARHYGTSANDIYGLFESAGYGIYLLSGWLRGRPPLSEHSLLGEVRKHWYFLAAPRPPAPG